MRCVVAVVALAFVPLCLANGADYYPVPLNDAGMDMDFVFPDDSWKTQDPYRSAGMVISKFSSGREFFGSGVVARSSKIIFSCAHVAYDRGRWASRIGFARAYSRQADPTDANFVFARGFRKLAGYAPRSWDYAFEYDFIVAYSGSGFGTPVDCHRSAKDALLGGGVPKMILGYPSTIDYFEGLNEYVPGFSYLHRTGPFATAFYQDEPVTGSYLAVDGVTTGPGNSGGPVFVEEDGRQLLAGILVSGDEDSAGVYALNAESELAVDSALAAVNAGTTRTVPFGRPTPLRDGSEEYREVRFDFSSMPPEVTRVVLRWTFSAANAGDIVAMLQSPPDDNGNVTTVSLPKQAFISGLDLSSEFAGFRANGVWKLFVRDSVPGGRTVLRRASLSLTSRWAD